MVQPAAGAATEGGYSLEDRTVAADELWAVYKGSETAEDYFFSVLLPNMLPEYYPEEQSEATWIGAKAKASIHLSKLALANHFRELVEQGELTEETALGCAGILDIPLVSTAAKILQFRCSEQG